MVTKLYKLSTAPQLQSTKDGKQKPGISPQANVTKVSSPSQIFKQKSQSPTENNGEGTAYLDEVFTLLGWMGSHQKIQCFLLMLPIVDCAFHFMSFIFIGKFIDHKCAGVSQWDLAASSGIYLNISHIFPNSTAEDLGSRLLVTTEACSLRVINQSHEVYSGACPNGYEYADPPDRSFESEWNLVCEKEALPDLSQTVMLTGMMFGASLFTVLADKFGKKPTYVICHILLFGVALVTALAPDFPTFVALRFLLGALQQGIALTSWILMLELLPTSKREWPSRVGSFVWSFGLLLLGLICYLCRGMSWRHTELVLASISCYSLLQWWLVDESLRWFTVQGKSKEAEEFIVKVAKRNGVEAGEILGKYRCADRDLPRSKNTNVTGKTESDVQSTKFHSMFMSSNERSGTENSFSTFVVKNKQILKLTVNVCFIWFTDTLAYLTLIFTSQSLNDDFYLGYTLNILVELPAATVFCIFISRIGRRYCAMAAHQICGVALLVAVLLTNIPAAAKIPGVGILILVSTLLAKFGVSFAFAVLWLYTPELFPTTIRTTGFGLASVVSRLAGMVAPYSRTVSRHYPWAPGTVLSVLCLTVSLLVKFLPETHGHDLPQTVAEMDVWLRDKHGERTEKTQANRSAENSTDEEQKF